MVNRWGNNGNSDRLHILELQNYCRWWLHSWNWKKSAPWKKSYDQPRQILKSINLPTILHIVKAMVFLVVMCRCEHWTIKKAECRRIDAFELSCSKDSWVSLDCKNIQPVLPKGDQSWVFIGGTDTEAEAPKLWSPDVKSWLIGKYPHAGKDWSQEKKGMIEDEMV